MTTKTNAIDYYDFKYFRVLGAKKTIIIGLTFEMLQLLWYGFGNQTWMMWAAGILAALASITYPAISAFVSIHSTADRQGIILIQGNGSEIWI